MKIYDVTVPVSERSGLKVIRAWILSKLSIDMETMPMFNRSVWVFTPERMSMRQIISSKAQSVDLDLKTLIGKCRVLQRLAADVMSVEPEHMCCRSSGS
ncbi:MAG: hypothetical protein R2681_17710 [Pyrinomonadaceae bacterium]